MIKAYEPSLFTKLYVYYKTKTFKDGFYVLQSENQFLEYLKHICYISIDFDVVDGFILGSIDKNNAYLDLLYGESNQLELLNAFEQHINALGINNISCSFRSVIKKPFYVLDTHIHKNAQGILKDSPLFEFLTQNGYKQVSLQSTYHLNLDTFHLDKSIEDLSTILESNGIKVTLYQNTYDLDSFYQGMNNKEFEHSIKTNQNRPNPNPLLVAVKDNHVIGFSGPLSLEDSRGVFHGISVLDAYQGMKIGKVLFNMMCEYLKTLGATYITLFTGDENPARFLYVQTGFVKMHTFAMLKKEL